MYAPCTGSDNDRSLHNRIAYYYNIGILGMELVIIIVIIVIVHVYHRRWFRSASSDGVYEFVFMFYTFHNQVGITPDKFYLRIVILLFIVDMNLYHLLMRSEMIHLI